MISDLAFLAVFVWVAVRFSLGVIRPNLAGAEDRAQAEAERRLDDPLGALIPVFSRAFLLVLCIGLAWFVADFRWFWLFVAVSPGTIVTLGLISLVGIRLTGREVAKKERPPDYVATQKSKILARQREARPVFAIGLALWFWSWRGFLIGLF